MIITNAEGKRFTVHFRHINHPEPHPRKKGVKIDHWHTEVYFHAGECGEKRESPCTVPSYADSSYVHPKDQFCRSTGRKLAFGRVLRRAGFSYAERQELWAGYFTALETARRKSLERL